MATIKKGLGKGLGTLFGENAADSNQLIELRLSEIEPNRAQPRKEFDEAALRELADSIKEHGLLQPITVRPYGDLGYQIIAGERRWRASRLAGLETVPVIVKELDDRECAEIALIENLQREDLNPVEEALGYRHLMESYELTQEQVAETVGKSRPVVANSLRLLSLDEETLALVSAGDISVGHARAMISLDESTRRLAVEMALKGATVRAIEALSKQKTEKKSGKKQVKSNPFFKETEIALKNSLGRKIKVDGTEKKGVLMIEFYGKDDLTAIANLLAGKE
ncbi:MAG: ParB/RepB/Spo0J family partition protein [Clostridia bacterium]|nr:ParB/RepB/Spo0J family partition protein [Clostridia bacterium]